MWRKALTGAWRAAAVGPSLARPCVLARPCLVASVGGRGRSTSADGPQEEPKKERPAAMGQRDAKAHLRGKGGPVGWPNLVATGMVVSIITGAYYYAKSKKDAQREAERREEVGKAKIGGTFSLLDEEGRPRSSRDFYGKWVLLYFGFTHCPDICPDEMEKMAEVHDLLKEDAKRNKMIGETVPLFITVDPERDSVAAVKEYVKEFHPEMVGLTGSTEQVKEACKQFRVYFSAGPRDEDNDYIVDHTIIIYLLDPEGQFVDYYGQTKSADQIARSVKLQMTKYMAHQKKGLLTQLTG